jgi:uncharacterized membrane protein
LKDRLYFIDIVRTFAILMMLQGHFIDTLLDNSYRNLASESFALWSFFRGITAPLFFTISGLIFTYLLLKAKDKGLENYRIKKGITRGFYLISIGYLIRINFKNLFSGTISSSFFEVDVLQCIGLSLILTVSIFFLCNKKIILFSIVTLILGTLIFVFEPLYRVLNIEGIPLLIHNYISQSNGSVFRILPWYGYSSMGAFIATLFYWNLDKKHFKTTLISSFIFTGLVLVFYSSDILMQVFSVTKIEILSEAADYNYLFTKLGYVLLYFAFFYSLEKFLKHSLILKIGKNTLAIYVIHFILLYGSFFGIGFKIIGKNLSPVEVSIGTLIFLILVLYISFNYTKVKPILKRYSIKLRTPVISFKN